MSRLCSMIGGGGVSSWEEVGNLWWLWWCVSGGEFRRWRWALNHALEVSMVGGGIGWDYG